MGLFKDIKNVADLTRMGTQLERPSMREGLSMSRDLVADQVELQRLQRVGHRVPGKVLEVRDGGNQAGQAMLQDVLLEVQWPGHPYQAWARVTGSTMGALYAPGSAVEVLVDPDDATRVAIDPMASGMALVNQANELTARAVAANAAATQAANDPAARLTRLAELHQKGLLTDAEFAAQKQRILNEM